MTRAAWPAPGRRRPRRVGAAAPAGAQHREQVPAAATSSSTAAASPSDAPAPSNAGASSCTPTAKPDPAQQGPPLDACRRPPAGRPRWRCRTSASPPTSSDRARPAAPSRAARRAGHRHGGHRDQHRARARPASAARRGARPSAVHPAAAASSAATPNSATWPSSCHTLAARAASTGGSSRHPAGGPSARGDQLRPPVRADRAGQRQQHRRGERGGAGQRFDGAGPATEREHRPAGGDQQHQQQQISGQPAPVRAASTDRPPDVRSITMGHLDRSRTAGARRSRPRRNVGETFTMGFAVYPKFVTQRT